MDGDNTMNKGEEAIAAQVSEEPQCSNGAGVMGASIDEQLVVTLTLLFPLLPDQGLLSLCSARCTFFLLYLSLSIPGFCPGVTQAYITAPPTLTLQAELLASVIV